MAEKECVSQRLLDRTAFLDERLVLIQEWDEQLLKRLIAKITVFDDKFIIELKADWKVKLKNK